MRSRDSFMVSVLALALLQGAGCKDDDELIKRFDKANVTSISGKFVDGGKAAAFVATESETVKILHVLREARRASDVRDAGFASVRIEHVDGTVTRVGIGERRIHVNGKVFDNDERILDVLEEIRARKEAEEGPE